MSEAENPPYTVQYSHNRRNWFDLSGPAPQSFDIWDEALVWYERLLGYHGLLRYVRMLDGSGFEVLISEIQKGRQKEMAHTDCCKSETQPEIRAGWLQRLDAIQDVLKESLAIEAEIVGPVVQEGRESKSPGHLSDGLGYRLCEIESLSHAVLEQLNQIRAQF